MAANEGAGGIDVFDLFTNTKSDIGANPFRVDDHAREEFASLPDHEKRRLGYEEMLTRKLLDLVRQCDRLVSRNKEKLRREVAQAMKQRTGGRGNREDLIVTVNEEMLNDCAANVANAFLIEEEMAELVEKLEGLESEEKELLQVLSEEAEKKKEEDKEKEPPKKKKKKSKDKDALAESESAQTPTNDVDPRLLVMQKKKLTTLLHIQSLSLQLPPLRDKTDNLLRQLQYLRSDTSTDKVVCDVSSNFMSSRDADERIAAHYAGKQYIGWKLVREKLKELQKRGFGMGDSHSHGRGGGGYIGGHNNSRGGGNYDNRGQDRGHHYNDKRGGGHYGGGGGGGGGYHQGHGGGRNDRDYRSRDHDRYDRRGRW